MPRLYGETASCPKRGVRAARSASHCDATIVVALCS